MHMQVSVWNLKFQIWHQKIHTIQKRSSVLSLKTAEPWVSTSFRNLICRHMPWRSQEPSRTLWPKRQAAIINIWSRNWTSEKMVHWMQPNPYGHSTSKVMIRYLTKTPRYISEPMNSTETAEMNISEASLIPWSSTSREQDVTSVCGEAFPTKTVKPRLHPKMYSWTSGTPDMQIRRICMTWDMTWSIPWKEAFTLYLLQDIIQTTWIPRTFTTTGYRIISAVLF